jgi:hypothetical protein
LIWFTIFFNSSEKNQLFFHCISFEAINTLFCEFVTSPLSPSLRLQMIFQ